MASPLRSPAFATTPFTPATHNSEGDNTPPPLTWTDVPEGTVEFALLFEDPDAPGGTLVHWVRFGITPDLDGLEEGKAPPGALGGKNDYGRTHRTGPSPPTANAHRLLLPPLHR